MFVCFYQFEGFYRIENKIVFYLQLFEHDFPFHLQICICKMVLRQVFGFHSDIFCCFYLFFLRQKRIDAETGRNSRS